MKKSRAVGWLATFLFMNVLTLLYYFAIMIPLVRGILAFHREKRRNGLIGDVNNLEEEEDGERVTYFNMWRGAGEGPIRIGKQINIGSNLYSLLFYACVRQEYTLAAQGKLPAKEEVEVKASIN